MLADKLKGSGDGFDKGKDGGGGGDKRFLFPEHLSPHAINVGVKTKSILQGVFYLSRTNYLEGTVNCEGMESPVLVQGLQNQNRSVDGDHVAIQGYSYDQTLGLGWVDFDLFVPMSPQFCLGRWKTGRIGRAVVQSYGIPNSKSTKLMCLTI